MPGPLERDTCRDYVLPRLRVAGWTDDQIIEQFRITDGRVITVGNRHRRGEALIADYVLEYRPGAPVAVVEAKREYAAPGKGMQQAKRYAQRLDVPFAYSTNGTGIVEDDQHTGIEDDRLTCFPSPMELWARFQRWKGGGEEAMKGYLTPFNRLVRNPADGSVKEPRYYQRVAINRVVEAVLRGDKRMLLTLATGTGKTFVAMQIAWKLWGQTWRSDRNPRVLYLADRNILVDQPIEREFTQAFGEGPLWKLKGEAKAGREIYFAIYQALADSGADPNGMFRDFSTDFFDLVIVDECHRGSARVESSWRAILDHFAPATQLGLTATPRREETADTYEYFGNPLYEYSLAQGIEDGFLAPYRVRRVVLSPDAYGWSPTTDQLDLFGREIPPGLYTTAHFERVVSLLSRTEAAARHLTNYLRATDRMAKTIVFCVDQDHADQMRRAIHNANTDLTTQYPNYTVRIVSEEGAIGRAHLDDFGDISRQTPVVATTSHLLTTGVDLPAVRNIVLFRPVGSIALFKQMIGRGTRLCPDADKLSFDIIDYSGATALFSDPEFDGPPERVVQEQVDDEGNPVVEPEVNEPEPPFAPDEPPEAYGADPADVGEPRAKFYVDDVDVWVTADAAYHLDPESQRLRLVKYRDLVAEAIRGPFPDVHALRLRWASRDGREEVLHLLEARGIDATGLCERTGLPTDTDLLDALVHLAWNHPLATRSERARRVRKNHTEFFAEYQPAAREVLVQLLDSYARHGINELDDLGVLQVPPLSALGSPAEIAARFGSAGALRTAVTRLSGLLYAG